MLRVEWRESARADLLAIIDYISDYNPDAAQRMKDDIEAKAINLAEYPKRHRPGRIAGTREMVVHPNYLIIYSAGDESVVILRILHAAQQWPLSTD